MDRIYELKDCHNAYLGDVPEKDILWDIVSKLKYGEVTIKKENGKIVNVKKTESIKLK